MKPIALGVPSDVHSFAACPICRKTVGLFDMTFHFWDADGEKTKGTVRSAVPHRASCGRPCAMAVQLLTSKPLRVHDERCSVCDPNHAEAY